jgi:autophagy-related protein 13
VELDRSILGFGESHLFEAPISLFSTTRRTNVYILFSDERLSPTQRSPLPTSTHTFPPVPHLLGSFTLHTTYLSTPHFQLDELESLLSSRFISLDLEGFVPTLDKNKQRDSLSGSSSLPNSSGIRSMLSRSPPKAVGMGRTTSAGGEPIVADLFILPTRVPSMGAPTTGTTALIPPPRPSFAFPSANPSTTSVAAAQPIPASGLPVHRLRRESLNSSSSSSISTRDRDNPNPYPYPANLSNPSNPNLFSAGGTGTTTAAAGASVGGTSSLSSSPIPGALPIRRPHLNPVHPFKSNTISSGSGSSPSLSIRQGVSGHAQGHAPFVAGGGSPSSGVGGILPHNLHSRQASASSARVPPSPVHVASFTPSSLGDRDRRPGTSGSGSRASLDKDRERRGSSSSGAAMGGDRETETERTTHEGMSVPMPMPPRKRYSSSFGHRYVSSVGSATGGGVVGAGSGAGSASASGSGISAGSGGKVVGEGGSPGSGNGSGVGVGSGGAGGGARKEVCFFYFYLFFFEFVVGVFPMFAHPYIHSFLGYLTHSSFNISAYPSSDVSLFF